MKPRAGTGLTLLVIGLALAATGLHWLITPSAHSSASAARTIAVWAQVGVGVVLAIIGQRLDTLDRRALSQSYHAVGAAALRSLMGALLVGTGGHWLITPLAHPAAPGWQVGAVWVQIALGIWLLTSAARRRRKLVAT